MLTRAAISLTTLAAAAAAVSLLPRATVKIDPSTVGPVSLCFAPDTQWTPELEDRMTAVNNAIAEYLGVDPNNPFGDRYKLGSRWSGTQGSPRVITWSFVPDGLSITGASSVGDATSDSSLFATFDAKYARATWISRFQACFDRWQELTGITFTRVKSGANDWDDGGAWLASGSATRGDMRISMHPIDGSSNVLAYCYFPSTGDMVLDKNDAFGNSNFFNSSNSNIFLRNTVTHEMGHGLGLNHVCPINNTKLMEPFLSLAFDGPRHDDVRAVQRHYGDINEPDNTAAEAVDSGLLLAGASRTLGTIPNAAISNSSTLSIDANSEVDYHAFSTNQIVLATVTLTPVGLTYDNSTQASNGSCNSGSFFDSLAACDLAFDVRTGADALITTVNATGAGSPETFAGVLLSPPGSYLLKVYENNSPSESQLYSLTITNSAPCSVTATDNKLSYVALSWTNVPSATTYTIKRNVINSEVGATTIGTSATNSFNDLSAPDNKTNFYYVYATQFGTSRLVGFDSGFAKCTGDLNNDGQVNDADFVSFANAYNILDCADPAMPAGCPADFNASGIVDDIDFTLFVAAYDNLLCP